MPPAPVASPNWISSGVYSKLAARFDDIDSRAAAMASLIPVLPPDALVRMQGGQAMYDAAAPAERLDSMHRKLLTAAGKGGSTLNTIRSLIVGPFSLTAYAASKLPPGTPVFPVPPARAVAFAAWRESISAATANGGGGSIESNVFSALQAGRDHAGLDISLEGAVADRVVVQRTDAGESCAAKSLYLMCFDEHGAKHAPTDAARYAHREQVIQDAHSFRMAQHLRSAVHLPIASAAVEAPCLEVSLSKDGVVKDRSAMAPSGFLGPFDWLDAHLARRATVPKARGKEPSTYPRLVCPQGYANDPYHPSARLDFTQPAAESSVTKIISSLRSRAGISKERQKAIKSTKHASHAAFANLASGLQWRPEIQDELGKWAGEASKPTAAARGRSRGPAGRKRVMRARYTSDQALENQAKMRARLVEAVRAILDTTKWRDFPRETNTGLFAGVPNLYSSPFYGASAI